MQDIPSNESTGPTSLQEPHRGSGGRPHPYMCLADHGSSDVLGRNSLAMSGGSLQACASLCVQHRAAQPAGPRAGGRVSSTDPGRGPEPDPGSACPVQAPGPGPWPRAGPRGRCLAERWNGRCALSAKERLLVPVGDRPVQTDYLRYCYNSGRSQIRIRQ